jgi:RNA polymerase-binding transcription factor DksA
VEEIRQRLELDLERVCDELDRLEERLSIKGEYGHGKGDPLVVRWELDLARRRQVEEEIELIEAALQRINEGRYGICEQCGGSIRDERLEVLPYTRLCMACATNG